LFFIQSLRAESGCGIQRALAAGVHKPYFSVSLDTRARLASEGWQRHTAAWHDPGNRPPRRWDQLTADRYISPCLSVCLSARRYAGFALTVSRQNNGLLTWRANDPRKPT